MSRVLIALLVPFSITLAQVSPLWHTVPFQGESDLTAIVTDNSGSIIASGYTSATSSGEDYYVVKYSPTGQKIWQAFYNGPANSFDISNDIAVDGQGNIYVTGYSSNGNNTADIATIKFDSQGAQQWVVRYNSTGFGFNVGNKLAADSQGNIYLTGYSTNASGNMDVVTIKYNPAGIQQFVLFYTGTGSSTDEGKTISVDNTGFIYVCGSTSGAGSQDYLALKYNSSGTLQWASAYNGTASGTDVLTSSGTDAAGNVYLTGYSDGPGTYEDCATVKFNSSGVQQWAARYNGTLSLYDRANSLVLDSAGNVYITGYTQQAGIRLDAVTIKYSPAGTQLWADIYDDTTHQTDVANLIAVNGTGVVVAGLSSSMLTVLKYSPTGTRQWVGRHSDFGSNPKAMVLAYGGIYLAGDFGTPCFVAKFSEEVPQIPVLFQPGNDTLLSFPLSFVRHRWFKQHLASGYKFQLALDSSFTNILANDSTLTDTVKVTIGITQGTTYWWRVSAKSYFGSSPWSAAWKYTTSVIGIEPISSAIPGEFRLYPNYPNPFNPVTKIRFDIPAFSGSRAVGVKLFIYSVLGKEMAVLVNENLSPGEYEAEWNALELASGIYFYRIVAGNYVNTQKMVVVK